LLVGRIEFVGLALQLAPEMIESRQSGQGFDSPNARSNCCFATNGKQTELSCAGYVGASAKFHRISIELTGMPTDLDNSHGVPVLFAKELHDIISSSHFLIRYLDP